MAISYDQIKEAVAAAEAANDFVKPAESMLATFKEDKDPYCISYSTYGGRVNTMMVAADLEGQAREDQEQYKFEKQLFCIFLETVLSSRRANLLEKQAKVFELVNGVNPLK